MMDVLGAGTLDDYIELTVERVACRILIKSFTETETLRPIIKPLTESLTVNIEQKIYTDKIPFLLRG